MKKYFYSFFAAVALMLSATSCSQDELVGNGTTGDEAVVTFNVEMEGQIASRAIGDGQTVDQLFLAVYDESGNEITTLRQDEANNNYVIVENLGAVAKVRLVKGQTYQFVFWAQKRGAGHYNTDDMKAIKVNNYTTISNDETRDAFYAYVAPIKVTGSFNQTVTLKRPFAQLNLGTSAKDLSWASNAGVTIAKTAVKVTGEVYSQLNTFDGSLAAPVTAEFELNVIPDMDSEMLIIDDSEDQFENDEYYYLSSSYLLAPSNKALSEEIIFTLVDKNDKEINKLYVYNAPLQRNWRTNIVGDILTGEGTFNIVIDPIFDADRNYWMDGTVLDIWNGETTTPELVNGEYVIDQASDLLGLAEMDESSLTGKTFVLTKDLSFKNVETRAGDTKPATIKPFFTGNKEKGARNIIFKGNGHVIRDFVIEGETNFSSLFGILTGATIEDLTIINADVTGRQNEDANAAVLVAKTFGKIKLNNVTVKDSKLKAVQKVGGLIGYSGDNTDSEITNCTVQNLNVESIEMTNESGATGGLIGHINEGKIKINNSYVRESILDLIQSVNEAKRANSEFIGVINNGTIEIINCGVEDNLFTNSISWTPYHNPFVGGKRGSATLKVNGKTFQPVPTYTEDYKISDAMDSLDDWTSGDIVAKRISNGIFNTIVLDVTHSSILLENVVVKEQLQFDCANTLLLKNVTFEKKGSLKFFSGASSSDFQFIVCAGTVKVGDTIVTSSNIRDLLGIPNSYSNIMITTF